MHSCLLARAVSSTSRAQLSAPSPFINNIRPSAWPLLSGLACFHHPFKPSGIQSSTFMQFFHAKQCSTHLQQSSQRTAQPSHLCSGLIPFLVFIAPCSFNDWHTYFWLALKFIVLQSQSLHSFSVCLKNEWIRQRPRVPEVEITGSSD